MSDATFTRPGLIIFTGVADLGLQVTGQHVASGRVVLVCRVVDADEWCRRCGCEQ